MTDDNEELDALQDDLRFAAEGSEVYWARRFDAAADTIAALRARVAELEQWQEQLTGMKFSDRMHAALLSRAELAESQLQQVKADAERYQWLRDTHKQVHYTTPPLSDSLKNYGVRTNDMIQIDLPCFHLGPHDEPIWRDGEHFDFAANMDAAIDAARRNDGTA